VLLPGGAPAPHAWVLAGVDEDAREASAGSERDPLEQAGKPLDREGILLRADAEGRFASDEIPGGHVLLVGRTASDEAPLLGWTTRFVRGDVPEELVVHLQPGAEVAGFVRAPDGTPVPGVTLEAEWEGTRALGQMEDDLGPFVSDRRAVAGEDGSFRLAGLLPGDHDLRVYGRHAELLRAERVLGVAERAVWNPVVEPPCTLDVRVLGPDGAPLAGWRAAAGDGVPADFEHRRSALTDAEGRARLRDLPPDRELAVAVYPPRTGALGLPAAVRAGARAERVPRELEVRLATSELPTAAVRGRLVEAGGAAVPYASVELVQAGWNSGWTILTDVDGAFAFDALAPGEVRIRARTRALPGGFELLAAPLGARETRDVGDVVVPAGAALVVRVRAGDGGTVGSLLVELASADPDGAALVQRWERDGATYTASAPVGDAVLRVQGGGFAAWCEPVCVPPGGATVDVVLETAEATRLRLLLPTDAGAGGRAERARLCVWDARGLCVIDTRVNMTFGGEAERVVTLQKRLAPGAYRVRAELRRAGARAVERALQVAPEGAELELDLR
jgi:hypothetical protein